MDITVLQEFIDLAQTCSYQETAANMNISASSLSKHISRLEDELGVSLFNRTTRNVVLNEYGVVFLRHARKVTELMANCNKELQSMRKHNISHLTIGYWPMLEHYGLLELIADFSNIYPSIKISMVLAEPEHLMFDSDNCDFFFASNILTKEGSYNYIPYVCDHLAVILPQNHPFAADKEVSIEQLKDENFILHGASNDEKCRETKDFLRLCTQYHIKPNIVLMAQNFSTITKLVKKGIGIAIINRMTGTRYAVDGISMLDLTPITPLKIFCLYPKGRQLTSAGKKFIRFIRQYHELQTKNDSLEDAARE